MKKRILIVSHAMELGGAERSLLGLLDALDPKQCAVDLFLLRYEGELMPMIPAHVKLLPEVPAYTVLARPMRTTLKEGHIVLTAARLAGKIAANLFAAKHQYTDSGVALEYSHKFTCPFMPEINPDLEYDLAISFLTPHYFVIQKVRAKIKLAWIHTDYSTVQVDVASELAMWGTYDHIVSISDAVTESFLSTFPSLKDKILPIGNILPERLIRAQAEEVLPAGEMPEDGSIRLLSVGRYCTAKNFDNVPDICARLVKMGQDIKWYIIGFGDDEELIRKKIAESNMGESVILLEKKDNPYPYMAACDLYVQPSRYEGKCVSVIEAQILGKPVVITRYPTCPNQLEDGVDGMIVPMDNDSCANGIATLLQDPEKMKRLAETCKTRDYSNSVEIEKIYQLLED